jgi:ribonuclease BN (tRNA processing enzyme)
MTFELIVAGAGPAYTSRPGAVGAAYLVRSGPDVLLFDLGHGAFANCAGLVEPSALRAVIISHLHPDHFIDLIPLRHYLRYEFNPPRRMEVLGPAGLAGRIDALLNEPSFAAEALDIADLGGAGTRRLGEFSVEAGLVRHIEESYAFRISTGTGPGLVYSGDCGDADDLRPLIRRGDALLSEVSFGTGPVAPGAEHIGAAEVGRLAAGTGAGRVILTHLLAGQDRAATVAAVARLADVQVDLVDPGDRFTI